MSFEAPDSHPVSAAFAKNYPWWHWESWFQSWDSGLLWATIFSLVVMTGYLLWPHPQAQLTLSTSTPFATESPTTEAIAIESSTINVPSDSETTSSHRSKTKRTRHAHAAKKKPDKPPVTNINTATLEQLQLLPGIGPKMAERVVDYRKANGRFQNLEQIMEVKGIGPKKFEKMKTFLKI